ncbi:hypothetical protein, partial [Pseudomonas viridiflava]|uniref:hypothetical protein n=1 Tax=Pseudomonas viridiflava TaxID=33069 RepID=UPI001CA93727
LRTAALGCDQVPLTAPHVSRPRVTRGARGCIGHCLPNSHAVVLVLAPVAHRRTGLHVPTRG